MINRPELLFHLTIDEIAILIQGPSSSLLARLLKFFLLKKMRLINGLAIYPNEFAQIGKK